MLTKISLICNGFECSIGTKRQFRIPFHYFITLIHYKWLHEPNLQTCRTRISRKVTWWLGLAWGKIKRRLKLLAIWKDC